MVEINGQKITKKEYAAEYQQLDLAGFVEAVSCFIPDEAEQTWKHTSQHHKQSLFDLYKDLEEQGDNGLHGAIFTWGEFLNERCTL